MATRRKGTVNTVNAAINHEPADIWQNTGATKLINGVMVTRWNNTITNENVWMQPGQHPEDEELAEKNPQYINEILDEIETPEETPADRVMTLLQSARGEGRAELNVYRITNGERQYCAKYKPEDFEEGSFELLRSNFGAGEYELRLYATDPRTNRFVVRSQTRIKIAESKAPAPDTLPAGLAQVLGTIAQGQERMLNALVEMKQAPQKDPMEEMTKMLNMMQLMREAMGLNVQQSREKSSIGEIVSAIKELKGAAAEFTPEEKEPADLMGMLPKVLEMVSAGQQQQAAQIAAQPTYIPPVAMPASLQPAPQTQTQTQTEGDDVNLMTMIKLKGYLKSLTDMAAADKPVSEGAKFVYDKLPDDLIEIMALDNWFELLSGVAPEVKAHEKWLKDTRNAALKLFDVSDEETAEN